MSTVLESPSAPAAETAYPAQANACPHNERLMRLARRMATELAANPALRAVTVVGSAARGTPDDASDVDMIAFYDELPTEDELEATRLRLCGSERIMYLRDTAGEGRIGESYYLEGVKHDVVYRHIPRWRKKVAEIVEGFDAGSPYQKSLQGLFDAVPLLGAEQVEAWRREFAYPDGLAEAMVRRHLRIRPLRLLRNLAAGRNDLLYWYEMLVETHRNVLGILLGLNRQYHFFEFKHLDQMAARMSIAPPQLAARIRHQLRAEPADACAPLAQLVEETLALVERHLPQVDVSEARTRFRGLD